jgi:hypothetical protein
MFRRRPVVVTRARPGIIGTMARTAVIAGTATAVSKGVSNAMSGGDQQQAAAQSQAEQTQAEMDQMQAQMAAMQAQQNQITAAPAAPDLITQLQQLAQLKEAGALSDAEFEAAKAKLLA